MLTIYYQPMFRINFALINFTCTVNVSFTITYYYKMAYKCFCKDKSLCRITKLNQIIQNSRGVHSVSNLEEMM